MINSMKRLRIPKRPSEADHFKAWSLIPYVIAVIGFIAFKDKALQPWLENLLGMMLVYGGFAFSVEMGWRSSSKRKIFMVIALTVAPTISMLSIYHGGTPSQVGWITLTMLHLCWGFGFLSWSIVDGAHNPPTKSEKLPDLAWLLIAAATLAAAGFIQFTDTIAEQAPALIYAQ